ncbi:MAG TPA: DUF5615 family PIN-like protein [Gemmataceae bacterium]|nr:DUF5615 family PIN-like protein [Gemmataceae bacterium]
MPIAYYMDEHVQTAITRGLRHRGVDAPTIQEDGLLHADDEAILDRAIALGRVVFTRDEDFSLKRLVASWQGCRSPESSMPTSSAQQLVSVLATSN